MPTYLVVIQVCVVVFSGVRSRVAIAFVAGKTVEKHL